MLNSQFLITLFFNNALLLYAPRQMPASSAVCCDTCEQCIRYSVAWKFTAFAADCAIGFEVR